MVPEMGIGRPDGMLTRLSLRTIPLHRLRMKNSGSMRPIMLLSVMLFSFIFGCFGGIGSQAARFLCTLAFLELRQHDALSARAGLAPLSRSARSQFSARCSRQSTPRISADSAKAPVMRLAGAPSLPSPTYLPHRFCASDQGCRPVRGCPSHPFLKNDFN